MNEQMHLKLGLSGPELINALHKLTQLEPFEHELPTSLEVDFKKRKITPDWLEQWSPSCQKMLMAFWGSDYSYFLTYRPNIIVQAAFNFQRDAQSVLSLLTSLPFELVSFATLYPQQWESMGYIAPSFSQLHYQHGWACAFQGAGHDRLVSRRWLEYGPWRLLRGSNDTTLVQFHDLEADAETALQQAKPGHERMGISPVGGFIQLAYVYEHDLRGLYDADQRKLKIVVHGREVSQQEMLDACAARYYQVLWPEHPLDNIAYVFMDEANALAHLHELWLRELECWAITDGLEVRLDTDYHPVPIKPEWVRRVEEREAVR